MEDVIATAISSNNHFSQHEVAALFKIPRSTLGHRIRGRPNRYTGQQKRMLLSLKEEESLVRIIGRMCEWNWAPPKVQIKLMAADIMLAKSDNMEVSLGKNWVDRFPGRHLELKKT